MDAEGWACPECGFELYLPVRAASLRVSRLGLYSDGRFPGRCLLVYRDHVEHLEALPGQDLAAFWSDATTAGAALRRLTGATRVNYAVLGNAVPHLHVHLVPRQPSDPLPTRPPWNDPRPLVEVGPVEATRVIGELERLLR